MFLLPRLTTVGNQLVVMSRGGPVPVRLKGLNRSGLQHKPTLERAGMADPRAELRAWRESWGARIVRLPLAVDYWLEVPGYPDEIDTVVRAAAEEKMYLILELHGTSSRLNEPLPTDGAEVAWAELARRYGTQSHLAFDLWNEPHSVDWATWRAAAARLLGTVRRAGAEETLVLVGGLDWAYDLSPLLDTANRLCDLGPVAYATHPYPHKGQPPHGPREWEERFGCVARALPVLVTEFGADDSGQPGYGFGTAQEADRWLMALLAYVDGLGLTTLAWSAGDRPQLTLGLGGGPVSLPAAAPNPMAPTVPFGVRVRDWMLAPAGKGAPEPEP